MGKSGGRKKKLPPPAAKSAPAAVEQKAPPSAPPVANGAMPHQVQVDLGVLVRRAREFKEDGNRLFQSGDYPGALRQYELALSLAPSGHPDRAVFHSNSAACLLQIRPVDHNAIVKECSLALQVDRHFPRALIRRAHAFQALGLYERALVDALKLVALQPDHSDAVNLAKALRSQISSSSTSASTPSTRASPAFSPSAVIVGRDPSQDTGDSTKEVAESEQSGHYRAREFKEDGNRLFQSGNYPGALRQYELALSLAPSGHPDRAVFHSNRVECLLKIRPVDQNAIAEECSLALQVDPHYPRALIRRAHALQALGRYELALVDALAFLALHPDHRDAVDLAQALRARISLSSTSASTPSTCGPTSHPSPAFSPSAVIAGRDPSQDAGDSTKEVAESEQCGHYSRDVPHLNKLLFEIMSSKSKHLPSPGCNDCTGADGEKGSAAKPKGNKDDIWVCLHCGQSFCGGLVSDAVPYGHARRHCRKNRHSWAARYDKPNVVYCVSCKNTVTIKIPSEIPKVEEAATAADKLIGVAASNELVLANSHGNVIKGLPNLGNTCFFNSVLQSVLSLDKFRSKMLGPDVPKGRIYKSLKKLFVETSSSNDSGGLLNPQSLYRSICQKFPFFEGNRMQDSHELLRCLLDVLDEEETEARKLAEDATSPGVPKIVDSIFEGQLSSSISSIECNHGSVKQDKFLDISVPVPSRKTPAKSASSPPVNLTSFGEPEVTSETTTSVGTDASADEEVDSKSHVSVEDCLALFTTIEPLSAPWHCEHCSTGSVVPVYRTAKKRILISKAPPVLTITLNRFSQDINGQYKKLKGHVRFEETLDIGPFIDPRFQENYSTTYRLIAVVEHMGTIDKGHYVAYVKSGKIQGWQQQQQQSRDSKSWFCASDEHVTEFSMQEVQNCEAYILFYERVIEQD